MTAWRHLTPADYLRQPWANGRGETHEIARKDGPDGMVWRLSIATVAENGPFSRLPGTDRWLTVIDGPGFDLIGERWRRRAAPLSPVAFPGDPDVAAAGVAGPSRDFNVMVRRGRMLARVACGSAGLRLSGDVLALHTPLGARIALNGQGLRLGPGDTILTAGSCVILPDRPVLTVALTATA